MAKFKTYSISSDTLNSKLSADALDSQMRANTTLSNIFDGINRTQGEDSFTCHLVVERTTAIDTAMDSVVSAHDGENIPESPKDSDNAPIVRVRAFNNTDNLRFRGTGVAGTITKNTTGNIDYKLTENRFINGIHLLIKNHVWGDNIDFQVIDIDNILGYGTNVVLDEFGSDWYINPDKCDQGALRIEYPALLNKDLYVRIKYTSTGTTNDVEVKCNLFLHKKPI
jgi:hypothetical protein